MKGWPGELDMEHDVLVAQGPAAAADGKPISNVIFDFGNVLIYWDPSGVWGLSNWEKELFPIALKHCEILQRLDGRLVSGYVHMRKPHKDIYEKALEEFGISAESSVFIDDKAMNIAGANEAGIRGIRFSDARKLRELLIEQGIDIPAVQ